MTAFPRQRLRVVEGDRDFIIMGSDVRHTNPSGTCALCGHRGTLLLSHIVPRWAYHWAKAEGKPRGHSSTHDNIYEVQDGAKHYLLCETCEARLGHAERYLSLLSRGRSQDLQRIGVHLRPGPVLENIDFDLIMRGVLGILLKSHFAAAPPHQRIKLDAKLVDRMRTRILRDDYPSSSLFLVCTKWLSSRQPGVNPRAMVLMEQSVIDNTTFVDMMFGGWSWVTFLSSPSRVRREQTLAQYILRRGEPWRIMVGELEQHRYFGEVEFDEEPWLQSATDVACPCGLGLDTFDRCCLPTWCAS